MARKGSGFVMVALILIATAIFLFFGMAMGDYAFTQANETMNDTSTEYAVAEEMTDFSALFFGPVGNMILLLLIVLLVVVVFVLFSRRRR